MQQKRLLICFHKSQMRRDCSESLLSLAYRKSYDVVDVAEWACEAGEILAFPRFDIKVHLSLFAALSNEGICIPGISVIMHT